MENSENRDPRMLRLWDTDCDPLILAQKRAETYNSMAGSLSGYDCPKCKNRGSIMYAREDGTDYTVPCSCMKIRSSIRKLKQSGLQTRVKHCTFEKFQVRESWQKAILNAARAYSENPEGWLLLSGQSGCGKTHLCTAICRIRLLKGQQVRYLSWREELPVLKNWDDGERRERTMEELQQAELLYIDDFLKTGSGGQDGPRPTAADLGLGFEILNSRYNSDLPTLISTEFTPEEILSMDEALGSRIVEKAGDHILVVAKKPGRNYRLKKVRTL